MARTHSTSVSDEYDHSRGHQVAQILADEYDLDDLDDGTGVYAAELHVYLWLEPPRRMTKRQKLRWIKGHESAIAAAAHLLRSTGMSRRNEQLLDKLVPVLPDRFETYLTSLPDEPEENPRKVAGLTPTQRSALLGLDGHPETRPVAHFLADHTRAMPSLIKAGLVESGTVMSGRGRGGGKQYWLTDAGQDVVDEMKRQPNPPNKARPAIIILHGAKGDKRDIRKILTAAIKGVIDKRWEPWMYTSAREMSRQYGEPEPARFNMDVTDDEMLRILDAAKTSFIAAGWRDGEYPIEVYHD